MESAADIQDLTEYHGILSNCNGPLFFYTLNKQNSTKYYILSNKFPQKRKASCNFGLDIIFPQSLYLHGLLLSPLYPHRFPQGKPGRMNVIAPDV